jgi:hypothetical protein
LAACFYKIVTSATTLKCFQPKIKLGGFKVIKSINNVLKKIMLSFFYLFLVGMLIFAFYFIKNLLGVAEDFQLNLSYMFSVMLKSIGLMFNLFFAYIFFIKLIIKQKNIIKAKNNMLIWLVVLILNIIINDLLFVLLSYYLNIDLLFVNIIAFLILYFTNKIIKKRLLQKRD